MSQSQFEMKLFVTQCVMMLVLVCLTGCDREAKPAPVKILPQDLKEPTFVEQLADVRSGASDRIHLVKTAAGDEELEQLQDVANLRELLLDESQVTSSGLQPLMTLPHLEHLRLRGQPVDDAALQTIAQIKSLRVLNLPHGNFTDGGVLALQELPELVQLRLGSDQLTDRSLAAMMKFPKLLRIHLLGAPITDAGLRAVQGNQKLESLYLDNSLITENGLRELFAALPELHVHINQAHADFDPRRDDHQHE